MRRLSKSEREIRSSRGISIWRFWPYPTAFLLLLVMSFDRAALQRCPAWPPGLGSSGANRYVALIEMVMTLICSPWYVTGPVHALVFIGLLACAVFAVLNYLSIKRHTAYWDVARAREKVKRAEKKAPKLATDEGSDGA